MSKAIVIFSGGIDSTVCLAIAKQNHDEIYAISFNYGQRHQIELEAASAIAKKLAINEHIIFDINLKQFGASALTNDNIELPAYSEEQKITSSYVPARNTIFLSIALGYAESKQANAIYFGANYEDAHGFPDTRPEYMHAFEKVAALATKAGVQGQGFTIETPLISLNKAGIIKRGKDLNIDFSDTITCYQADSQGYACGECESCQIRHQGFIEAGISDPTKYLDLPPKKF